VTGFATCFGLELRALCSRRLTQIGAGAAILAAVVAAAAALRVDPEANLQVVNGWRCLAIGMGAGMTVASLVALLLGSQALSASAAEGSLRSTLCRPVSRNAVLAAHAAALAVVALLLGLAVVLSSAAVGLGGGFGDVMYGYAGGLYPGAGGDAGSMARHALLLGLGAPLSVCTAAWMGLAVSVSTDNPGIAAGTALIGGIGLGMGAISRSFNTPKSYPVIDWIFLRPGLRVWQAFRELADGAGATLAWERAPLGAALGVPLVTMLAIGAFALWWFRRRDVLS